jgi:hypothetical protein
VVLQADEESKTISHPASAHEVDLNQISHGSGSYSTGGGDFQQDMWGSIRTWTILTQPVLS